MKKNNILTQTNEGIIIKSSKSGEKALVFTALTNDNEKISIYSANKKKQLGSFEIFDICIFEFIENENVLKKLKNFDFVFSPKKLREDFVKFCSTSTLLEVFNVLTKEGDKTLGIYDLLKSSILKIENETETLKVFRTLYETLFYLLSILGFENKNNKKIASKKNLLEILKNIEHISEHSLKSIETLKMVLPTKKL